MQTQNYHRAHRKTVTVISKNETIVSATETIRSKNSNFDSVMLNDELFRKCTRHGAIKRAFTHHGIII